MVLFIFSYVFGMLLICLMLLKLRCVLMSLVVLLLKVWLVGEVSWNGIGCLYFYYIIISCK